MEMKTATDPFVAKAGQMLVAERERGELACSYCGATFTSYLRFRKLPTARYCSRPCGRRARYQASKLRANDRQQNAESAA